LAAMTLCNACGLRSAKRIVPPSGAVLMVGSEASSSEGSNGTAYAVSADPNAAPMALSGFSETDALNVTINVVSNVYRVSHAVSQPCPISPLTNDIMPMPFNPPLHQERMPHTPPFQGMRHPMTTQLMPMQSQSLSMPPRNGSLPLGSAAPPTTQQQMQMASMPQMRMQTPFATPTQVQHMYMAHTGMVTLNAPLTHGMGQHVPFPVGQQPMARSMAANQYSYPMGVGHAVQPPLASSMPLSIPLASHVTLPVHGAMKQCSSLNQPMGMCASLEV